jgi:hypothetical protein
VRSHFLGCTFWFGKWTHFGGRPRNAFSRVHICAVPCCVVLRGRIRACRTKIDPSEVFSGGSWPCGTSGFAGKCWCALGFRSGGPCLAVSRFACVSGQTPVRFFSSCYRDVHTLLVVLGTLPCRRQCMHSGASDAAFHCELRRASLPGKGPAMHI